MNTGYIRITFILILLYLIMSFFEKSHTFAGSGGNDTTNSVSIDITNVKIENKAFKVGEKLTFSIDPGKKIGLMVFLDNYYFDSYCCYRTEELIEKIVKIMRVFQINNPDLIHVDFKFGRGVLSITYELVKNIYKIFKSRQNLRVYLIDESRTSKIKNLNKFKGKKVSKDEISALILAMREGIEVTHENYIKIFNQIKSKKLKLNPISKRDIESNNGALFKIEDIIEKVLSGECSLIESSQLIKNNII